MSEKKRRVGPQGVSSHWSNRACMCALECYEEKGKLVFQVGINHGLSTEFREEMFRVDWSRGWYLATNGDKGGQLRLG